MNAPDNNTQGAKRKAEGVPDGGRGQKRPAIQLFSPRRIIPALTTAGATNTVSQLRPIKAGKKSKPDLFINKQKPAPPTTPTHAADGPPPSSAGPGPVPRRAATPGQAPSSKTAPLVPTSSSKAAQSRPISGPKTTTTTPNSKIPLPNISSNGAGSPPKAVRPAVKDQQKGGPYKNAQRPEPGPSHAPPLRPADAPDFHTTAADGSSNDHKAYLACQQETRDKCDSYLQKAAVVLGEPCTSTRQLLFLGNHPKRMPLAARDNSTEYLEHSSELLEVTGGKQSSAFFWQGKVSEKRYGTKLAALSPNDLKEAVYQARHAVGNAANEARRQDRVQQTKIQKKTHETIKKGRANSFHL